MSRTTLQRIRTPIYLLAASLLLSGQAIAQEDAPHWSVNSGIFSKYLGTIGGVFYDDPILVTDLTVSHGDYYAGIWNSTRLGSGKYGKTFGDEYDFYAGWSHDIGPVKYEITGMYFLIADLAKLNDDLWVIDQKLSMPSCPVFQPYVKVRAFNTVGADSPTGGFFFWAGVNRSQPTGLMAHGQEVILDVELATAYSDGPLGKTPGSVFARLTLGTTIPLSERLSLKPSAVWQTTIGGQKDYAHPLTTKTEVVCGLSLNAVF